MTFYGLIKNLKPLGGGHDKEPNYLGGADTPKMSIIWGADIIGFCRALVKHLPYLEQNELTIKQNELTIALLGKMPCRTK